MKQKIITAFKTKYQRFGLSNEAIDRIASAKEKTVTKDEEIESAIADAQTMELIANELQKMRDKEIQSRTDLQTSFNEYKEKHPETNPDPKPDPKTNDDEPEWAKRLREQNEQLLARQQAEDNAKAQRELNERMESKLKEAGCTNPGVLTATLKGFALAKDETEDAAAERLKGEYNASIKAIFGDGPIPQVGVTAFGDAKTALEKKNAFLRQQGLLPKEEK